TEGLTPSALTGDNWLIEQDRERSTVADFEDTSCPLASSPRGHQFQRELTAEGRHLQPAASWDSKKNPSAKWHEALHGPVSLSPVRSQALPRGTGRRPAGSGRRGRPSPGWTSARVVWRRRQWALFGNRDFESMRPLDRTVLGA